MFTHPSWKGMVAMQSCGCEKIHEGQPGLQEDRPRFRAEVKTKPEISDEVTEGEKEGEKGRERMRWGRKIKEKALSKALSRIFFNKQAKNSSLLQFTEQAQPDPRMGYSVNSAGQCHAPTLQPEASFPVSENTFTKCIPGSLTHFLE